MLFAILSSALAATYTVPFAINQTAPVASIPASQQIIWVQSYGQNEDIPDLTVQSSWAPVTCVVQGGILEARFTATRTTWPTSWPSTATCSYSFGNPSNTLDVTLQISNCTSSVCARNDAAVVLAACSSPWTFTGTGLWSTACQLPTPPNGKLYALPADASGDSWSARYQIGGSPAPDTDSKVGSVQCGLLWDTTPNPDVWLLDVVVGDSIPSDLTVYCPLRMYTTATKAFSWGSTPVNIVVDRP